MHPAAGGCPCAPCRASGLKPNAVVIVATVCALKMHGGGPPVVAGGALPLQQGTRARRHHSPCIDATCARRRMLSALARPCCPNPCLSQVQHAAPRLHPPSPTPHPPPSHTRTRPACAAPPAPLHLHATHAQLHPPPLAPSRPRPSTGTPLPHAYKTEDVELLRAGCSNLSRHITNARAYGVPVVVAINQFASDSPAELEAVKQAALEAGGWRGRRGSSAPGRPATQLTHAAGAVPHTPPGMPPFAHQCWMFLPPDPPTPPVCCPPPHLCAGAEAAVISNHHALGGAGAVDLAEAVVAACSRPSDFRFLYDTQLSIKVGRAGGVRVWLRGRGLMNTQLSRWVGWWGAAAEMGMRVGGVGQFPGSCLWGGWPDSTGEAVEVAPTPLLGGRRTRLQPLPAAPTGQLPSPTRPRRRPRSTSSRAWALRTCRCAWPRRSTASATTPRSKVGPRVGAGAWREWLFFGGGGGSAAQCRVV